MSTYIDAYERIVRAIGQGFHPDTDGGDYETLPEGIRPHHVNDAIDAVIEAGGDPYAIANAILNPPTVTVGAPVSVTLRHDGSLEVEVDLSEFLDGALESIEDGNDCFTEAEARSVDKALEAALAARSGRASGRLVVTLFPGAE